MKKKRALYALVPVAVFAVWLFLFHPPYFRAETGWLTHNGQEYRLESWHSNSPFVSDHVRFVLRHRNGAFSAVSPSGFLPKATCPALDDCVISLFTGDSEPDIDPAEWKVDLEKITAIPNPAAALNLSPDFWGAKESGFIKAKDFFFIGNVWLTNLISAISLYCGFLTACMLLATAAARLPRLCDLFLGLLVLTPFICGIGIAYVDAIVTYNTILMTTGKATLFFLPIWAICFFSYRRALRNPSKRPKLRVAVLVFLTVFFMGLPFLQTAMQGNISDGDMTRIIAVDLKQDDLEAFK